MSFNRLNLLFSETYLQDDRKMREVMLGLSDLADVLVDSGAHSNYYIWKQQVNGKKPSNKPVTLDHYLKACQFYDGRVWQYIMLDVVKDPAQSEINLQEMLNQGLTPMPVMVIGDPIARASKLLQINRKVAVAGAVNYTGDNPIETRFREIAKTGVDIHALGYGRYPDTLTLPIASADASSWCSGQQYGYINRYDYRDGFQRIRWVDLRPSSDLSSAQRKRWLSWMISDLGMTREQILDPETYRNPEGLPNLSTVFAYLRFAHHTAQRGVRFFLSVPNAGWTCPIIATLSAMSLDGETFDYPDARQIMARLRRDLNQNIDRYIATARDVLKRRTDWQTALP